MTESRKVVTIAPENSETPLDRVRSWVTPNRLFFVRDHFEVPQIDANAWRLSMTGRFDRPCEITWAELLEMPTRSVFATVECAGNGRSFLSPAVHGVQWGAGAIGHAEWTGVPLRNVLTAAGVCDDAFEIVAYGADCGTEADHPQTMHYSRGLPLKKALHPDTLLAYRMNGELLDPVHGFPVRLFVPGWYGVASVKWLTRLEAMASPYDGYYQTKKYTYRRTTPRGAETEVVGPMVIKSEIVRPRPGDTLSPGANRVFGVAWAGEESVTSVEVSVDGGATWRQADLQGPSSTYGWRLWEFLWNEPQAGEYTIMARAFASNGDVQPLSHDPDRGGYLINFSRPQSVTLADAAESERGSDANMLVYDMNAYAQEMSERPLDVNLEFDCGGGI